MRARMRRAQEKRKRKTKNYARAWTQRPRRLPRLIRLVFLLLKYPFRSIHFSFASDFSAGVKPYNLLDRSIMSSVFFIDSGTRLFTRTDTICGALLKRAYYPELSRKNRTIQYLYFPSPRTRIRNVRRGVWGCDVCFVGYWIWVDYSRLGAQLDYSSCFSGCFYVWTSEVSQGIGYSCVDCFPSECGPPFSCLDCQHVICKCAIWVEVWCGYCKVYEFLGVFRQIVIWY